MPAYLFTFMAWYCCRRDLVLNILVFQIKVTFLYTQCCKPDVFLGLLCFALWSIRINNISTQHFFGVQVFVCNTLWHWKLTWLLYQEKKIYPKNIFFCNISWRNVLQAWFPWTFEYPWAGTPWSILPSHNYSQLDKYLNRYIIIQQIKLRRGFFFSFIFF